MKVSIRSTEIMIWGGPEALISCGICVPKHPRKDRYDLGSIPVRYDGSALDSFDTVLRWPQRGLQRGVERLEIAQPPLSRAIQQLEADGGGRHLDFTTSDGSLAASRGGGTKLIAKAMATGTLSRTRRIASPLGRPRSTPASEGRFGYPTDEEAAADRFTLLLNSSSLLQVAILIEIDVGRIEYRKRYDRIGPHDVNLFSKQPCQFLTHIVSAFDDDPEQQIPARADR